MSNKNQKEILVGSDYSGVGAFNQSLIRLGVNYKELFACDYNFFARQTFLLNFGTKEDVKLSKSKFHKMFCDGMKDIILNEGKTKRFDKLCKSFDILEDYNLEDKIIQFSKLANKFAKQFSFYYPFNVYDREIPKESASIYMTSPPCQAFSMAGKRLGKEDLRGILFFNSLEFIKENKPRYFIFENVKGLLSHDKTDKKKEYGNTFQEWINYLGGKSVNGVPTIFPFEDSVPYHIYFQVQNAKYYNIPQNRERVFIIGIRDDEDNNFQFPKELPLEKRLKDVLEAEVDEKYFLGEKTLQYFFKHKEEHKEKGNGFGFKPQDVNDNHANSLTTKYGSRQSDTYLKVGTWRTHEDGKAFREMEDNLCPTIPARAIENGSGQPVIKMIGYTRNKKGKVISRHDKDISGTIHTSSGSGCSTDQFVKIGAIRGRNPKNPKSRETGLETEQMLEINENGTSNALTTVQKDNVVVISTNNKKGYDEAEEEEDSINYSNLNSKTRRGRIGKGVAQTLDTACEQGIFTQQRIRRLTPLECFKLMDFNFGIPNVPDFKWDVSDSQAYKQAGNSIAVGVLAANIKKILKLD